MMGTHIIKWTECVNIDLNSEQIILWTSEALSLFAVLCERKNRRIRQTQVAWIRNPENNPAAAKHFVSESQLLCQDNCVSFAGLRERAILLSKKETT